MTDSKTIASTNGVEEYLKVRYFISSRDDVTHVVQMNEMMKSLAFY